MPRSNLTLKQKCQIIELSGELSTEQLAKKFHVHPTTVTRTLQKRTKIQEHASRVNVNFKTVQTNQRGQEHDKMILEYIRQKQLANEPITIKEICDKAVEFAKSLSRTIKSKRGWWRRFKVRCNIIRSKVQKTTERPSVLVVHKDVSSLNKRKYVKKLHVDNGKKKSYTFKIRETLTGGKSDIQIDRDPPLASEAGAQDKQL